MRLFADACGRRAWCRIGKQSCAFAAGCRGTVLVPNSWLQARDGLVRLPARDLPSGVPLRCASAARRSAHAGRFGCGEHGPWGDGAGRCGELPTPYAAGGTARRPRIRPAATCPQSCSIRRSLRRCCGIWRALWSGYPTTSDGRGAEQRSDAVVENRPDSSRFQEPLRPGSSIIV